MQSRYGERNKKRRQNLFLNGLIAVVFILILVVGANLLLGPTPDKANSDAATSNENNDHTNSNENDSIEVAVEENDEEGSEADDESLEKDEEENEDEEKNEDGYQFKGGGPEGPWEPIGTKQTGEHVSVYEKGTVDWEEKEMAIAYGAGLLEQLHEDNLIFWRIGNGGSPQKSIGRVSTKTERDKVYVVAIEWIDGKGWQPTSVEIEGQN